MATNCNTTNSIAAVSKKIYRTSLPLKLHCLNFNANKGTGITNIKHDSAENRSIPKGLSKNCGNSAGLYVVIKAKDAIIIPLAGVGKPIKEVVCRVSLLNIAKRMAENMAMKKMGIITHSIPSL